MEHFRKGILALLCTGVLLQAQVNSPVEIQLQKLTVGGAERVGIDVTLGGTFNQLYLLDTGSSPFVSAWATNSPAWWGAFMVVDPNPPGSPVTYTGQRLYFKEVTSTISIDGLTTGPSYRVSQAYERENKVGNSWVVDNQWKTDVLNGVAPDSNTFFGTMGADLANNTNGFYGFIKQFTYGPGITEGFIVHAAGESPSVTVGLDAANMARFTSFTSLNTNGAAYAQDPVNADYKIIDGGVTNILGNGVRTLFDTGDPKPVLTRGVDLHIDDALIVGNYLKSGVTLKLSLPNGLLWDYTSDGSNISVSGLNSDPGGAVNSGIAFFNSFDILYDTQNGLIAFAAVPEPSTNALLLFTGLGIVFVVLKKKVKIKEF